MVRDLLILPIGGKFWVYCWGQVRVPFADGKMYRVFDDVESAVAFRRLAANSYRV